MYKDRKKIIDFLKPIPAPLSEIAEKIIHLIIANYKDLKFAIKWKKLTFGINHDFHHWLFAIQATKKNIGIVFHFGGLLEDKDQVFIKGESMFMRKLEFNSMQAIDWNIIACFIDQAMSRLEFFKANWKELNENKG